MDSSNQQAMRMALVVFRKWRAYDAAQAGILQ
jgi:hypothetical protein